jgi:hypothetical protein
MTTSAIPPDPFQSHSSPGDSMPEGDWVPRVGRPGGLTAVCIIAIVLGGLGVLGSLWGLAGLAFQSQMQEAFAMTKQPGMNEEAVKAGNEIQRVTQEMARRYRGVSVGMLAVNLAMAACMLAAAIMALKMNRTACVFLVAVFAVAIVFEIVRTAINVNIQLQTGAAIAEPMSRMLGATAKRQPGADQAAAMGTMIAKASVIFGVVVAVGLAIVKAVFYGVGAWYLRRPRIRELCRQTARDYI